LLLGPVFGTMMTDPVRHDAQAPYLKLYMLIQLCVSLQSAEGMIGHTEEDHIQAELVVCPFLLNFKWAFPSGCQC